MKRFHEYSRQTPDLEAPIPKFQPIAGWKEIPLEHTELTDEPLVPVGIFSDHRRVLASSVYADEHDNSPYEGGLEGSNIAVFMRESVAEKLDEAAKLLPHGMHLMVMDAYRSLEVQGSLFEQYISKLREQHPDWSDDELSTETQIYVSIPSTDPTRPSPHNTGASIDVVVVSVDNETQQLIDTIDLFLSNPSLPWQDEYFLEMKRSELLRVNAKMLDFGTSFDHGGPVAKLRHLEEKAKTEPLTEEEQTQLMNRRLLYHVMATAGMAPYEDEWWHYNDPASQMGAKVSGRKFAEYGAAPLSEKNKQFARIREVHHHNSVRLANGEEWTPPKGLEVHYALARAAVRGNDPRTVTEMLEDVERIQPPTDNAA